MILKQPLDRGLSLRSWILVAVVAGLALPAAPALRGQAPPAPPPASGGSSAAEAPPPAGGLVVPAPIPAPAPEPPRPASGFAVAAEPSSSPAPVSEQPGASPPVWPPRPPVPPVPPVAPAPGGLPYGTAVGPGGMSSPGQYPGPGVPVEDRLAALEATMGQVLEELRALRQGANRRPSAGSYSGPAPATAAAPASAAPSTVRATRRRPAPAVSTPRAADPFGVGGAASNAPAAGSKPSFDPESRPRALTARQEAAIQALEAKHREEIARLELSFRKAVDRILSEADVPEDPEDPVSGGSSASEPVLPRR